MSYYKDWDFGMQLTDAMRGASDCKVYVNKNDCPICGGNRNSRLHKAQKGRCARVLQQMRIENENKRN